MSAYVKTNLKKLQANKGAHRNNGVASQKASSSDYTLALLTKEPAVYSLPKSIVTPKSDFWLKNE